ncbi:MAG: DoxX family protein [Verrucomicrobia bacterium]|nr:DoxX family protein [Verrucomicrobiota bacterium]
METKMMRWGKAALRIALGALFVYAGMRKALDPGAFLQSIENYQILPHAAAVSSAFFLPYLEIFCGTALGFKRLQSGALAILGGLMCVFIAALLAAWLRGLNIDCGCFGEGDGKPHYALTLARDLGILAALAFLIWREDSED